jgi:hypothetical protein
VREVARQAREVEAWGSELLDPCALAAAQEAYQVIALAEQQTATNTRTSKTFGAVVVLQCRHPVEVDPAQFVGPLKAETLQAIVVASPCPLEVTVGLLALDGDDVIQEPASEDEQTCSSTIPLLVALRCACTERAERLLECVHRAILDRRTAGNLCGSAAVSVATLPVPHGVLRYLLRRCEGGLLSSAGP